MNLTKFKKYIFEPKNIDIVKFCFGLVLSILLSFLLLRSPHPKVKSKKGFEQNLNVMIPKDSVLFPFNAQNYSEVDALLGAYSLVKVYDAHKGKLLAENIKVLRAPKDPSQLAFLVPTDIANSFMEHGMDFRLALQKFTNKEPKLITNLEKHRLSNKKVVTYGE